jgi:hypothetical protein
MTDPVDDLLAELDTALDVHPSPELAARVRTRAAEDRAPAWRRRLLAVGVMSAAALVILALLSGGPREVLLPERAADDMVQRHEAVPTLTVNEPGAPVVGAATAARMPASAPRLVRTRRPIPRDTAPAVVISPSMRLGLEQLQADLASGRVTAESLRARESSIEPVVITPGVVMPGVVVLRTDDAGTGAPGADVGPTAS